jgi:hypothetical protein
VEDIAIVETLLGKRPASLERINAGGNNRVYSARFEGPLSADISSQVIIKLYHRNPADPRDRMGTEYRAHKFLWDHGIRTIARPIVSNDDLYAAAYSFLPGERIPPERIGPDDIRQAIIFAAQLKNLSGHRSAESLPPASEAFFSLLPLIENLKSRISRLSQATQAQDAAEVGFPLFFSQELLPRADSLIRVAVEKSRDVSGWNPALLQNLRTLSPSDFGFHNAIRDSLGVLSFCDFEYFGWDDPCKLISDFILHPAMSLSAQLASIFIKGVLRVFCEAEEEGEFRKRLQIVYPLFALKWTVIALNEFIPEERARRQFATAVQNLPEVLLKKIDVAKHLLSKTEVLPAAI